MEKNILRAERNTSQLQAQRSNIPAIVGVLLSIIAIISGGAFLWPTSQATPPQTVPAAAKETAQTISPPDKYDFAVAKAAEQSSRSSAKQPAPQPVTQTGSRQASFTQQNYKPKPLANIYASSTASPKNAKAHRADNKITSHSNTWQWQTRANDNRRGRFNWQEQNNQIIWRSVCSNYRAGSLEYRDCRKGAKQTFKRLCQENRYRPACAAENNFLP